MPVCEIMNSIRAMSNPFRYSHRVCVMAFDTFGYVLFLLLFGVARTSNYGFYSNYVDDYLADNGIHRCDLSLWSQPSSEKNDSGFRIRLDTNSQRYVPEKKYNVYLEAAVENSKFEKFLIIAESINNTDSGSFELENPALSKFSRDCPNTIEHTSLLPKQSIAVIWKAPSVNSGSVRIRAAVHDTRGNLYHGGNLTLELGQGELDASVIPKILETCGACNEASYQLVFEGLWSRQTHPKDFPPSIFDTKFDGIIGASHANEFRMWEFNTNASNGIAELADTGNTKLLEKELKAQSKHIRTVIKAKGLSDNHLNGKTHAIFRADDKNHLLSLIAKFSPSPDWVVGISALELCLPNNSWATSRVVNLYPIDVGTIDGFSYKVDTKVYTMPREAIRQISPIDNPRGPFYSETGSIQPLAKVTVLRQRLFGKSQCITSDGYRPKVNNNNHSNHRCAVTDWMEFGSCNCPAGWKRQIRQYINPNDRYNRHCSTVPITKKIRCQCKNSSNPLFTTSNDRLPMRPPTVGPSPSCDTTEWSSWSECTCSSNGGIALVPYRTRRRYYKNSISYKRCFELLHEKEECIDAPTCSPSSNGKCGVTSWSDWSPCNATCEMTMGMRVRTRLFYNPGDSASCNIPTVERESCQSERNNCNGRPEDICIEPKEVGPCNGNFKRWYYNVQGRRCEKFYYSGCRGNRNNFDTFTECYRVCQNALQGSPNGLPTPLPLDAVVDCKLSPWGEWSECSSTCGSAWRERRRMVEVNAQNGGKPCETKVYKRSKCKHLPPCEPIY